MTRSSWAECLGSACCNAWLPAPLLYPAYCGRTELACLQAGSLRWPHVSPLCSLSQHMGTQWAAAQYRHSSLKRLLQRSNRMHCHARWLSRPPPCASPRLRPPPWLGGPRLHPARPQLLSSCLAMTPCRATRCRGALALTATSAEAQQRWSAAPIVESCALGIGSGSCHLPVRVSAAGQPAHVPHIPLYQGPNTTCISGQWGALQGRRPRR